MMRSTTKTRLLLVAFTLIVLGWAQPGWSVNLDADLRRLTNELEQKFESARTGPYGVFVRENIAVIAGVYALFALFLLRGTKYRNAGWEHLGAVCIWPMVFAVWFVGGYWVAQTCREITQAHSGTLLFQGEFGWWFITLFTGIMGPLLMIALMLTLWIGVPLYVLFFLFVVPSVLYVILRLLVRLPLLTYHYLHYLTVPHPAETAYRAGVAEHLPIPELARNVADAMYRYDLKDFDGLPPQWKSKNYKKRIEAFDNLLKTQAGFLREHNAAWQKEEERFMDEFIKNLRLKSQLRE
jgi:hypothetical protein